MDALAEIRGIYFDECDEFMGQLESCLAAVSDGRATSEDINAAFRAVHSVKGGAGAFGLNELVEFATSSKPASTPCVRGASRSRTPR